MACSRKQNEILNKHMSISKKQEEIRNSRNIITRISSVLIKMWNPFGLHIIEEKNRTSQRASPHITLFKNDQRHIF